MNRLDLQAQAHAEDRPADAGRSRDMAGEGGDRPWVTVFVLQFLYVVSMLDRNLISLLVEPIRRRFGVTDFQISLLQGTAFGLFYVLCGYLAGWLLDRYARRYVVFWGVTIWSLSAASCGLAGSYLHLLLGRFGVGSGEAVLSPASYAMISSQFPRERLGFAMGVWATGSIIGGALSLVLGAAVVTWLTARGDVILPVLGQLEPWQQAFLLFGLPGLLVAPLVLLISRKVDRPAGSHHGSADHAQSLGSFVASRRTYLATHFTGYGLVTLVAYGQGAWLPTYLLRNFGMNLAAAGSGLAVATASGGILGFLLSGFVTDRLQARGVMDAQFRYSAGAAIVLTLAGVGAMLAPTPLLCITGIFFTYLTMSISGIAAANLQLATPPHLRARVSSLYIIAVNITGLCFGPSVVAAFTDFVFRDPMKVGSSIMMTYLIAGPLAALAFRLGYGPCRAAQNRMQPVPGGGLATPPA